MTNKKHFIPLIAIPLICLIIASFLDLEIAQAVYWKDNYFGIIMSALGELPIYLAISAIGGCFFFLGLRDEKIWLKIILWVLGVVALAIAIYYQGDHIISRNAFDIEDMWYVGYPIALVLCSLGFFLGIQLGKRSDNPHLLRTLIIMCVAILIPVLIVMIVKDIMARPRFRFLIGDVEAYTSVNIDDNFANWWETTGNELKEYILSGNPSLEDAISEEFKSFPSGHTNSTACVVVFLAYLGKIDSRYEKYQVPLFYIGLGWTMIMGFSRMTVGAHYLSDVSMGALISFVVFAVIDFMFYPTSKKQEDGKEVAISND